MHRNTLQAPLLFWIYSLVVLTALCGLLYVTLQQNYRTGANDPQIQLAEDAANALLTGAPLSDQVPAGDVALETSLAPFVVIYDNTGTPLTGNGYVGGQLLLVPPSVFQAIKPGSESRLTLQPQSDVRVAAVIVPFQGHGKSGFVLAGRSLREVEIREDNLTTMVFLGWLITAVVLFVASFIGFRLLRT